VRQGRSAHIVRFLQDAARRRLLLGADLLEELVAPRLSQGARDLRKLLIRQSNFLARHQS